MSTQPGMLPGDMFSFNEWQAARGRERTSPLLVSGPVAKALDALEQACQTEGLPYLVVLGLRDGDMQLSNLGTVPQNVSQPLLMARAAVVYDQAHKLALMAFGLQSLDINKFMNPQG